MKETKIVKRKPNWGHTDGCTSIDKNAQMPREPSGGEHKQVKS